MSELNLLVVNVGNSRTQLGQFVGTELRQQIQLENTTLPPLVPPIIVPLGGPAGVPGAGGLTVTEDVTTSIGVEVFLQFMIADPGGPQGFSFTNGLRLSLDP